MKSLYRVILSLALLISCSGSDDSSEENGRIPPSWAQDFPSVRAGATTADILLQTDRSSRVYFVISTSPLSLSAEDLRKNAVKPLDQSVKANGVVEVSAGTPVVKTITRLNQQSDFHVYFVAQNVSDTIYQRDVTALRFSTGSRQDTLEYTSVAENRKVKYLIYRPEEVLKYPEKSYPICYFLGGNGEVATAEKPVNMIRNGSLPEYIYKGNDVPMMVFSIQHVKQNWNVELINEGIIHGNSTYPVDLSKVYLTGMSGGGYGCWNYAVTYPDKLAAIVPLSGGGSTSKACNLKKVNVWAFHNQTDNIVPSSNTVNMINALNACPPEREVKQLLFPDSGHDCWRRVYDQNHSNWSKSPGVAKFDIYAWMLSKSRQ